MTATTVAIPYRTSYESVPETIKTEHVVQAINVGGRRVGYIETHYREFDDMVVFAFTPITKQGERLDGAVALAEGDRDKAGNVVDHDRLTRDTKDAFEKAVTSLVYSVVTA